VIANSFALVALDAKPNRFSFRTYPNQHHCFGLTGAEPMFFIAMSIEFIDNGSPFLSSFARCCAFAEQPSLMYL
jgi:hypothetical protein